MTAIETTAVLARLLQFTAAAVLGGASLFFVYGPQPEPAVRWPRRLVRAAAAAGALGALAWLMAQAGAVGEVQADALNPAMVWSVATETGFGHVALLRLGLFLLALAAAIVLRPSARAYWLSLGVLGAAASVSFAWTGHGAHDEGAAAVIHLTADALHLLAASVWLGALACLAGLLLAARKSPSAAGSAAVTGLVRFSAIGVAVVAVLVASGLVNSWFLVGPGGLVALPSTAYGRLLLAKLALFGLMLALAALNRYRHTPDVERALQVPQAGGAAFRPVLVSVLIESGLALGVLCLVSWMGTLSPTIDAVSS